MADSEKAYWLLKKAIWMLQGAGLTLADWSLGGGTALNLVWQFPRPSKNVDIFLENVQFLIRFTPRLND